MSRIRNLVGQLLPRALKRLILGRTEYGNLTYSQEGEDRILHSMLGYRPGRAPGFYVDVGAHHPERISNTFLFYEMGWAGINIDAMPGSMVAFRHRRPRDTNIEAAIASKSQTLTFFEFNEPALNSFNQDLSALRTKDSRWRIVGRREIKTTRLDDLLETTLPPNKAIDFLSIDVEGLDLEVLQSNNWKAFRPAVVLVEDSEIDLHGGPFHSTINRFMSINGYVFSCKTPLTTFYIDPDKFRTTPVGLRLKD